MESTSGLTESRSTLGDLFADAHPGVHSRVEGAWDLERRLPLPRFRLCPMCSNTLIVKDWKFHKRDGQGSKSPWRCDVRLKCLGCSFVPIFGVVIPKQMYDDAPTKNAWIGWRAGKELLGV